MEIITNALIVIFVIYGIVRKARKAKKGGMPAESLSINALSGNFQLGGDKLNKLVLVFGQGSQITASDASILLNVSEEESNNLLLQLVSQKRAQQLPVQPGKVIKYKLL